jgi:hypothetical protein
MMQLKTLREKELEKWKVAAEVVDLSCTDVAIRRGRTKLGCTRKTLLKYVQWYKDGDVARFCHQNRGRKPVTTVSEEIRTFVVTLYRDTYYSASFAHFCEILAEDYHITLSEGTVHSILKEALLISPSSRKITKRKVEKQLRLIARKEHLSKAEGEHVSAAFSILDGYDVHPRKARSKYFGEMIQMDASEHVWVKKAGKWHLHAAVDDATGELVGAWFDYQETLNGYYHVLYMILKLYGIPSRFRTDRRTVFEYSLLSKTDEEKDTHTQFSAACRALGIELEASSTAQWKGRIERMNRTMQNRLPVEFIRNSITTIEQANAYLWQYLPSFNKQFSLKDEKDLATSVFLQSPPMAELNAILAVVSKRVVDAGHSISYHNNYYQPHIVERGQLRPLYYPKGTNALVIKAFDGSLLVSIKDKIHIMEEVPRRKTHSKEFDFPVAPKKKVPHKPGPDHPWKSSFLSTRILESHITKPKDGYLE